MPFCKCHKIAKCRVVNGKKPNELYRSFVNTENCGKRFAAPLYYFKSGILYIPASSSSHCFNNTDFEQYLFNENAIVTILLQFCPISTLAGMNLDHDFFQVSKLSEDQK